MTDVAIPLNGHRGLLQRPPKAAPGLWGWLTTVDHKKIGLLYLGTAFVFFVIGGIEALILRMQLGGPNGHVVSADVYNQIFTMHGTTMIFLVIMPLSAGCSCTAASCWAARPTAVGSATRRRR